MPITTVRRIMQVGGSKTVALPPGWMEAADLNLGDQVRVVADGAVLIMPIGMRLGLEQVQALVEIANRTTTKK